ncbi:MAG: hypothetical protein ACI91J_003190 [Yoonia sp.]
MHSLSRFSRIYADTGEFLPTTGFRVAFFRNNLPLCVRGRGNNPTETE